MLFRLSAAFAALALLGGCAHAYAPYPGDILAELPANAPPGECYARVRVPGQPVQGPPVVTGARWEARPAPPGAPGPIWCLVPTTSASVSWTPDRYGFVRVLCDDQLTGPRITGIQRELYGYGYYQGPFTGRYDAATAAAVAQFQTRAGIDHGGYLSFDTVQALDGGVGYGGGYYAGQTYGGGYSSYQTYSSGGAYAYGGRVSPCVETCAPVAPPPPAPPCCAVYAPPPMPLPSPCCVNYAPPPPPCPTACGGVSYYGPAAYGQAYAAASAYSGGAAYHSAPGYYGAPIPAYAAASASAGYGGAYASARASSSVQNGWLTWSGRGGY